MPRLQISDQMSIRQYVISDPANIAYNQSQKDITGTPSTVWQQQMAEACTQTQYIILYWDLYWDDDLYDKHNLQCRNDDYLPTDDEDDPDIVDTILSRALIEPWQPNFDAIKDQPHAEETRATPGLLDETAFIHVLVTKEGEPAYIPLSTNLGLKSKKRMLYFPMDVGELTIDGLIDTGAHSSAIPEADHWKIRLLAPQSIVKEGPAPTFQIMVANGQLETPKSTVELKFEVGDIEFHEIFIWKN